MALGGVPWELAVLCRGGIGKRFNSSSNHSILALGLIALLKYLGGSRDPECTLLSNPGVCNLVFCFVQNPAAKVVLVFLLWL